MSASPLAVLQDSTEWVDAENKFGGAGHPFTVDVGAGHRRLAETTYAIFQEVVAKERKAASEAVRPASGAEAMQASDMKPPKRRKRTLKWQWVENADLSVASHFECRA